VYVFFCDTCINVLYKTENFFQSDPKGIFITRFKNIITTAIFTLMVGGCASQDINIVARKNSAIQRCPGESAANKIEIIQGSPRLVYDSRQASIEGC